MEISPVSGHRKAIIVIRPKGPSFSSKIFVSVAFCLINGRRNSQNGVIELFGHLELSAAPQIERDQRAVTNHINNTFPGVFHLYNLTRVVVATKGQFSAVLVPIGQLVLPRVAIASPPAPVGLSVNQNVTHFVRTKV